MMKDTLLGLVIMASGAVGITIVIVLLALFRTYCGDTTIYRVLSHFYSGW